MVSRTLFRVSYSPWSSKLSAAVTPAIVDLLPSWRGASTLRARVLARSKATTRPPASSWPSWSRRPADGCGSIRREHVEAFLVDCVERGLSASTAANRYRSLQQLFRWLEDEGEIERSPMAKMRPPAVGEQPVDVLTEDELRRLFAARKGNTYKAGETPPYCGCSPRPALE